MFWYRIRLYGQIQGKRSAHPARLTIRPFSPVYHRLPERRWWRGLTMASCPRKAGFWRYASRGLGHLDEKKSTRGRACAAEAVAGTYWSWNGKRDRGTPSWATITH